MLQWFGKKTEFEAHTGLEANNLFDPDKDNPETSPHIEESNQTNEWSRNDEQISPEEYYSTHNIIEPCDEINDLCLTHGIENSWSREVDQINTENVDATDAAHAFGFSTEEEKFEINHYDNARILRQSGEVIGKWPSHAALVADITASSVLEKRDPNWSSYPPAIKATLLNNLRLFLEDFPTGDGGVELQNETTESCCTSYDVFVVTCEDTGERLFEHPVDQPKG